MHHGFLADFALVLTIGALIGLVAVRLKQPSILGYLLAGLVVGPYLPIPIYADPQRVHTMSELGVVLVMFTVGLELRLLRFVAVLPTAGATALAEVMTMLALGYGFGRVLGWSEVASLFLGAGLCISSTMVVSRVFDDQKASRALKDHVLGVLVVQDVLAITLAAVLTAVAAGGGLETSDLLRTIGKLLVVLVGTIAVGMLVVPRFVRRVVDLKRPEALVVLVTGLCFGLAAAAAAVGYSVALGAFLAGLLVAESGKGHEVEHLVAPLRDVFAAIFFVSIGMSVDPRLAWEHVDVALYATVLVIVGQLVVVGLAGVLSGNGLRKAVSSGLALGQIGEFAFILATIGSAAGVTPPELQPILVTVAVLTAFTTPIAMRGADAIVRWLDHHMPERLRTLLTLYEAWLERARTAPPSNPARAQVRRTLVATALDGALLTGVVVAVSVKFRWLRAIARERFELDGEWDERAVLLGAALLIVPIALHLVWTSRSFGAALARLAAGDSNERVQRLVQVFAQVLVLIAIGAPVFAILAPFVGATFSLPTSMALLVLALAYLWRRAGTFELDVRSGAERVLGMVARQGLATDSGSASRESLVDGVLGLDTVLRVGLEESAHAVGRTLTELDLRARSGASVVAIRHAGGEQKVVPTGREVLASGDVLVLAGSRGGLERAKAVLLEGRDLGD
ncbi:MAG: cation:proton antiporter [Sandaracinus sp.]|nr:cation:proton antiporter [Sandaracinus sp.]MCB9621092.1 cation:proton antiporter [Sandaracinus sp.]MCB9622563.1 cation:proton antiporter [Sandaracinus sp.]